MIDELDSSPDARDIDAERSLLVYGYLNFRKTATAAATAAAG